jgi:hypothetical protein
VTGVVLRDAIQDSEVHFCSGDHFLVVFSQFASCLLLQITTESIKAKLQLLHIWYMCSRTEIIQIKGDCRMLASKFHAGQERSQDLLWPQVSCNISATLCCSLSSVPTASHNQPICLFIYFVIYWACRSSVTSRCVAGVTGRTKAKGHIFHRNIRTTGHSATEHHFAAELNPY